MRGVIVFIMVAIVFAGSIACNSDRTVFGLPVFFVWNVFSVFLIAAGMWLVFQLDPRNRDKS